jgi:hypothetical protein
MERPSIMVTAFLLEAVACFQASAQKRNEIAFNLSVSPTIETCLADDSGQRPTASVRVFRDNLNDELLLTARHIKPHLQFDVFTVRRSNLRADGSVDPTFKNFGLAWYQSDLEADENGYAHISLRSIFLDQIFGFNANSGLPPVNTFHIGFWFNNPHDAAPCGFDPTKPTPFNGEHKAGPVAMISTPDATTGLGPLCTDPDLNHPGSCNP